MTLKTGVIFFGGSEKRKDWDVMKLKKSPPVNLTRSEEELLEAVRTDPMLAQHLTDVLKNFKKETDTGMDAYQVELHVVEATRDLGGMMLTRWVEQTEQSHREDYSRDESLVKHGKKTLLAMATSAKKK